MYVLYLHYCMLHESEVGSVTAGAERPTVHNELLLYLRTVPRNEVTSQQPSGRAIKSFLFTEKGWLSGNLGCAAKDKRHYSWC